MLDSTPAPLSQDTTPLSRIGLPQEIKQQSGEMSCQETVDGETNQSLDNEKENNEGPAVTAN